MAFIASLTLFFLCSCLPIVSNSKLNVPRVLLPIFNEFGTTFLLEATEGECYKWTTSRNDIISLTPVDTSDIECSSKVVVTAITKEPTRNIAVVLAEDVRTKQILRCDVIVDIIDSLALITTTRELFMEEAPEAFEVRAYDSQGNEFSTLEGAEFNWNIISLSQKKGTTILRFITFKDSPYETPPSIEKMEKDGKQGNIVLLEGIKTGSAKVIVKLPYNEYKHVKIFEVQLAVVANLIISPSDIYIMVGDTVGFQIAHINNGKMVNIDFPSVQYYLDIENNDIATINPLFGEVTGMKEGKTRVILYDTNMDDSDNGIKLPSTTVTVVSPLYMTLTMLPHRNLAILVLEHYDIVAEVFSADDHKIYLGQNVEVNMEVTELFHIEERSKNGNWLTGWAREEGVATVTATLEAVNHPTLGRTTIEPEITVQAEFIVYPHIIVSPPEIILPWDPYLKPKHDIEIKAVGGDGKFIWSSSNQSIGIVTQTGYVKTHWHGSFEVTVAMIKNLYIKEIAMVHILPPTRLEIIEFVMEAEVGSFIYLHVALYANKHIKGNSVPIEIPFTNCQELPFEVKLSDPNFMYNKSASMEPLGVSCANVAIMSNNIGICKVTISYVIEGVILEDSVTINTYSPLRQIYPESKEIVLAVGTSTHVMFTGGPKSIIGRSSVYKKSVISDDDLTVTAKDATDSQDNIVIYVMCLKLGSSSVTLSVTNNPLVPNCKNQENVLVVKVICGKPRSIFLQPEIKVADVNSCPMDLNADHVIVHSYKPLELDIIVIDEMGRKFLNISTLNLQWKIHPLDLGELGSENEIFSRNVTKNGITFANQSYQLITPKSETGNLEVTVTIQGYQKSKLRSYSITPEWPEFLDDDERYKTLPPIMAKINLHLVHDVEVKPNQISIYNHPGNKKRVKVNQGSGYYELTFNVNDIAIVKYLEGNRELEIWPLSEGELQISLVDLCLVSQPAIVAVHVVSVSVIKVEMLDKVEVGRRILCIVKLYDESENLLILPDAHLMDLNVNLEKNIADIKREKENLYKPWPQGEIHYIITGTKLGNSKLTFSIGQTASPALDLQVFSPLKIYPRNATLLFGSVLQFTTRGGPQPKSNVQFWIGNKDIANISSNGLAEGLSLGHSKVSAHALGIDSNTGVKIIYSEDEVDLYVIPIIGIKISIPLVRFRAGTTVPAWASGLPEQLSPIILGTIQTSLRFEWSVDDGDVISLEGAFKTFGVEYLPKDDISIRVNGLSPGHTTLHLNVIISGNIVDCLDCPQTIYSASVALEVFEGLSLMSPKGIDGSLILMAPHSVLQLKTNLDGFADLVYSLPTSLETFVDASSDKSLTVQNALINVSDKGLLQSFGIYGRAMVLITAIDEQGLKQTLSLIVEVKPIEYMLLNVMANWKVDVVHSHNTLPLGVEFELQASYQDNTGAKFTIGSMELKLSSTLLDLVQVRPGRDNSSILVSTKKAGCTVLKAFTDDTVDYIKLHIEQVVTPVIDYFTTGDIVCMRTPVKTLDGGTGYWSSSDQNLLTIDAKTGIGQVLGIKGGQVSIGHSLHVGASLHSQVFPAREIVVFPVSNEILTNAPDVPVYQIPLVIVDDKFSSKNKNLISGWDCRDQLRTSAISYPFTCRLEFQKGNAQVNIEKVFIIKSDFDVDKGQYSCNIHPTPEYNAGLSILDDNVTVWVELIGGEIESKSVNIQFIPAIFVSPELILDETTYSAVLSITGLDYVLDQVNVAAVDGHLLQVNVANRRQENLLTHSINLLDYHWKLEELVESMSLIVTSKLTKQVIKVHVKLRSSSYSNMDKTFIKHSPLYMFMHNYRHILIITLSILIIFFITLYGYSRYIQPVINVNVNPNRTLLTTNNSALGYSPGRNPITHTLSRSGSSSPNRNFYGNRESLYNDPNNFYSTSPQLRNRKFI